MKKKKLTPQELSAKIAEDNARFEALSLPEKRVAIAEDLLERIRIGQLLPSTGSIVGFPSQLDDESEEYEGQDLPTVPIKEFLDTTTTTCSVCAKGGLLMAYIGRVNQLSFNDLKADIKDNTSFCFDPESLHHKKLREIFDLEQLVLIEVAFEGRVILGDGTGGYTYDNREMVQKARTFYMTHGDESSRLEAIAKNIIENNGHFNP